MKFEIFGYLSAMQDMYNGNKLTFEYTTKPLYTSRYALSSHSSSEMSERSSLSHLIIPESA